MSALVKKEIRLLLPLWVGTLFLVALAACLLPANIEVRFFAAGVCCIILAAASYGMEFSYGTFSLLLSQPASRARIWKVKAAVLAGALLTVAFAFALCQKLVPTGPLESRHWLELLVDLSTAAGAFCAAILVRQIFAAFWLAWLIPVAILAASIFATGYFWPGADDLRPFVIGSLAIYSGLGIWWSRRSYFHAQDLASAGDRAVTFSWPMLWRRSKLKGASRRRAPWRALAMKECRLQTISLAAMAPLFLAHLAVVTLLNIPHEVEPSYWRELSTLARTLAAAWLVIPLLAGSASVADERRLGLADAQYCLPCSRTRVFAVKLIVVLLVGALLPAGFFHLLELHQKLDAQFTVFNLPNFSFSLVCLVFASVSLAGILGSTLAKQTTQAFFTGFSVVLVFLGAVVFAFEHEQFKFANHLLWEGKQGGYLLLLAMLTTLPWLAWLSFQNPYGRHRQKEVAIGLLSGIALPALLSTAIYHRVWELSTLSWQPPARISADAAPAAEIGDEITLRFPDGRLWRGSLDYGPPQPTLDRTPVGLRSHGFEEGSHWKTADPAGATTFAILDDGTLWYSELDKLGFDFPTCSSAPRFEHRAGSKMRQAGRESDWVEVSSGPFPYLLKRDGTLWHWGIDHANPASESLGTEIQYFAQYSKTNPSLQWPGIEAFQIFQVGSETDWKHVQGSWAEKENGETWSLSAGRNLWPGDAKVREISPGIWGRRIKTAGTSVQSEWRSASFSSDHAFSVGIKRDGTFWAWDVFWAYQFGKELIDRHEDGRVQVGSGSNWRTLMRIEKGVYADGVLLLNSDGALWKWEPSLDEEHRWQRLGRHQKWAALYPSWRGSLLVAADGSLWTWNAEPAEHEILGLPGIKMEPRELKRLGNIFD